MSNFKYSDILNMQYPNSEIEADFPDKILREAQFTPFAALTGYDEAIEETARLTDRKIELDEYAKERLNQKLIFVRENIDDDIFAGITYFVSDNRKAGGKYVTKFGSIIRIREYEKDIVFDDGTQIPIEDIIEIQLENFDESE